VVVQEASGSGLTAQERRETPVLMDHLTPVETCVKECAPPVLMTKSVKKDLREMKKKEKEEKEELKKIERLKKLYDKHEAEYKASGRDYGKGFSPRDEEKGFRAGMKVVYEGKTYKIDEVGVKTLNLTLNGSQIDEVAPKTYKAIENIVSTLAPVEAQPVPNKPVVLSMPKMDAPIEEWDAYSLQKFGMKWRDYQQKKRDEDKQREEAYKAKREAQAKARADKKKATDGAKAQKDLPEWILNHMKDPNPHAFLVYTFGTGDDRMVARKLGRRGAWDATKFLAVKGYSGGLLEVEPSVFYGTAPVVSKIKWEHTRLPTPVEVWEDEVNRTLAPFVKTDHKRLVKEKGLDKLLEEARRNYSNFKYTDTSQMSSFHSRKSLAEDKERLKPLTEALKVVEKQIDRLWSEAHHNIHGRWRKGEAFKGVPPLTSKPK